MKFLFVLSLIFVLQIVFADEELQCTEDGAGSYYIPKGCPKMDQNECQKLCDKLCASKVKNPKGYCGNVMRNVDADSCYCT
uniref:Putative secreted salivary protein n=1 Tax=Xenopsylla cheopis TaxID=163159 RepID=A2IAE3_XENCH|nr:putative secreted salivary protein [Xenopsylla cheopis]